MATGGDRRLGDYFTNALDENGCVLIASGDIMTKDGITGGPLPTSLPIFIRQTSGPALRGNRECSGGVVQATKAACRDRAAPTSRIAKGARIGEHNLRIRGTSRDRGCRRARRGRQPASRACGRGRPGPGEAVPVPARGRSFSRARSCSRPLYVKARGTKTWHLDLVGTFPKGTYRVTVRGTDSRRNVERPGKRQKITLRLR